MENVPASVGAEIFIALINPAISLVFALAFFALGLYQQHRPGMVLVGTAYTLAAAGFLIQYFRLPLFPEFSPLAANIAYASGGVAMAAGIVGCYGRPVPYLALGVLIGLGTCALALFLFVYPSLPARIYAVNFMLGGMCFVVAAELRAVAGRRPVDNALMALVLVAGFTFFARTLFVVATGSLPTDRSEFFTSVYWISLSFSWALLSMLIALALIARAGLDAMRDMADKEGIDPLTGLADRRGFESRAAALLQSSEPASLVLADLDGTTLVNDTYGRRAGNSVIAGFALRLRQAAGREAICGRIGGDEFAVLLPGVSANAARVMAEGLRVKFGRAAAPGLPGGIARVTASFGVAAHAEGETYGELQRRCDTALFEAKRTGRDRVVMARSPDAHWVDPAHDQQAAAPKLSRPGARKREWQA
jgi:diguanylate cyclase (GGDEF)-like protein